jgi:hypothetical protein
LELDKLFDNSDALITLSVFSIKSCRHKIIYYLFIIFVGLDCKFREIKLADNPTTCFRLGQFSWVLGLDCPCGASVSPAFRLDMTAIIFKTGGRHLQASLFTQLN